LRVLQQGAGGTGEGGGCRGMVGRGLINWDAVVAAGRRPARRRCEQGGVGCEMLGGGGWRLWGRREGAACHAGCAAWSVEGGDSWAKVGVGSVRGGSEVGCIILRCAEGGNRAEGVLRGGGGVSFCCSAAAAPSPPPLPLAAAADSCCCCLLALSLLLLLHNFHEEA
jgi:hypothetical protein